MYLWDLTKVKKMVTAEWYNHTLRVEVPRIKKDMDIVQVKTVTPVKNDTVTPGLNNSMPV